MHDFIFTRTESVGQLLIMYSNQNNGVLPDADSWSAVFLDELQKNKKLPQMKAEIALRYLSENQNDLGLALNKRVSSQKLKDVSDKTVLIYASAEDWGIYYSIYRAKHKYVYAFLKDGSIVKCRLSDGAVAIYDYNKDSFSRYQRSKEKIMKWKL